MKDLYTENYKTLIQEIDEDTILLGTICTILEELRLLKCPYYSKQSTGLMQFLSKF